MIRCLGAGRCKGVGEKVLLVLLCAPVVPFGRIQSVRLVQERYPFLLPSSYGQEGWVGPQLLRLGLWGPDVQTWR